MRPIWLVGAVLLSCHAEVRTTTTPPPPAGWHDDGGLTQAQGDEYCGREPPACRHGAFGIWVQPPSPCAHKGTRCIEESPPGHWQCSCNQCETSADCPQGTHCGLAERCTNEREPLACVPGPDVPPEPCPPAKIEPPVP
jgi:hypothetical protein